MGEDLDTAMARGLLMPRLPLRPSHGTDMVASTATDLVWATVMEDLDTAMARGLLMLRPSHGVAFTATDSVWATVREDWATAMAATATARGLLMPRLLLRPSHGTDMVAFTATDSQPTVVTPTAMARGLLMLRPSHGVASTAMDSVWATVMEDLDTAMAATAMASKQP